jgi:protein-tyrosine phosphatase
MISVLFVCLGNICRSPMAEGLFQSLVATGGMDRVIQADSAGTSCFHTGELPDPRMMQTASLHGIQLTHRARKLVVEDFGKFDYILSMDGANLEIILALQKKAMATAANGDTPSSAKVLMMRSFDPEVEDDLDVPDPYYGGTDGFEEVFSMLKRSNEQFLGFLREHHLQHNKTE